MEESKNLIPKQSEFLLYTTLEGKVNIDVFFQDETVWLTQKKMAELFDVDVRTINEHLQNIFKSRELSEDSVIRKFRIVQSEGGRDVEREVGFYNLDAIIAVGFPSVILELPLVIDGKSRIHYNKNINTLYPIFNPSIFVW